MALIGALALLVVLAGVAAAPVLLLGAAARERAARLPGNARPTPVAPRWRVLRALVAGVPVAGFGLAVLDGGWLDGLAGASGWTSVPAGLVMAVAFVAAMPTAIVGLVGPIELAGGVHTAVLAAAYWSIVADRAWALADAAHAGRGARRGAPARERPAKLDVVVAVVLAGWVATVAIVIEVGNARHPGRLGRGDEITAALALGANPKWRVAPWVDEESWRMYRGPRDQDWRPVEGPQTLDEQLRMERDIREARAERRFRSWVAGPGFGQYLLVPMLLCLVPRLRRSPVGGERRVGAVVAAVALAAACLMFYRQYFTSMGY